MSLWHINSLGQWVKKICPFGSFFHWRIMYFPFYTIIHISNSILMCQSVLMNAQLWINNIAGNLSKWALFTLAFSLFALFGKIQSFPYALLRLQQTNVCILMAEKKNWDQTCKKPIKYHISHQTDSAEMEIDAVMRPVLLNCNQ